MTLDHLATKPQPTGAGNVPGPPRNAKNERRFGPLDGVRAFAVVSVLLYHAGVPGVRGGLLGVDVFFVLSGFLITSLLCGEYVRSRTIVLKVFWARRARRLLPALFVLVGGVALYAWLFKDSVAVASVRGDAISTLLYVANWRFIFSGQGYFAHAAAPSPLLHTWSLGVEEQYYLLWPLVALFVLHRYGPRMLAWVAGLGAVASAALMGAMYVAGFSLDRLYYGTDTRMQALLVGSTLGAISALAAARGSPGERRPGEGSLRVVPAQWARSPAGAWAGRGLAVVGAACLIVAWHAFYGQQHWLYQGGFFLVALATGAVIVAVTSWPGGALARVCGLAPLVGIGRISYGLYLYHWPIFLAVDHTHTGLQGARLLAVRLGATLVVAVVSFFVLEEPIRKGRVLKNWRGRATSATAAIGTVVVLVLATITPSLPTEAASTSAVHFPSSEYRALVAAGAFASHPIRFMMVGDSLGVTLEIGLGYQSVRRAGVVMLGKSTLGCDLDWRKRIVIDGVAASSPHGCVGWQTRLGPLVKSTHPDIVGVLLGRWELYDHFDNGQVVHVGEPAWDAHLEAEIQQFVELSRSSGAKVVLFTAPYSAPNVEQADGQPYPENLPVRVDRFNRILYRVARRDKGTVSVLDLNRLLDPHGHFTRSVDGVVLRESDNIHISMDGGGWLQPRVLPFIDQVGLDDRAHVGTPLRGT